MDLEITDQWLSRLAVGDPVVAAEFMQRFGGPLNSVADKNLSEGLRARVDPEDIVQSACRTFFRRLANGQFELSDEQDLWHLVCAITLNKLRNQARFHHQQRRDVSGQATIDEGVAESLKSMDDPTWVAQWNEALATCFEGLNDQQTRIVEMRIEGHSQIEIAEEVGCTERTVRRVLTGVRDKLLKEADFNSSSE